jgi:hypothetical protein
LEGGPPIFRQDCSCPALLKDPSAAFPYGAVTRSGPPFQTLRVANTEATGLVRFRSPLLAESRLMSFPPATEMFQFAGFASRPYGFRSRYPQNKSTGGLPHSEIPGSPIARISPGLFAACHVLPRLSVPRHPPNALLLRLILYKDTAAHRSKTPARQPSHAKTLPRTANPPGKSHRETPRGRHPRSHHNSLFTLQSTRNSAIRIQLSEDLRSPTSDLSTFASPAQPPPGGGASGGAQSMPSGGDRDRTDDLLLAKQALSQLSYTPVSENRTAEIRKTELLPFRLLLLRFSGPGGPGRI